MIEEITMTSKTAPELAPVSKTRRRRPSRRWASLAGLGIAALFVGAGAVPAYALPGLSISMTALGDSITAGRNISGTPGDGAGDSLSSWSTGQHIAVNSHKSRLKDDDRFYMGSAYNNSRQDKTSANLYAQALNTSTKNDYTTILIGQSDVCNAATLSEMTTKAAYKSNVLAGIERTKDRSHNPDNVFALVSVPSMKSRYAVGITSSTAQAQYSTGNVCRIAMGSYAGETLAQAQARRDAVDVRIQEYNAALSEIAAADSNIFYDDGAGYSTVFTIAQLSPANFFDLSESGQNLLAQRTWDAFDDQGMYEHLLSKLD